MRVEKPYVLLKPVEEPRVPDVDMRWIVRDVNSEEIAAICRGISTSDILVVDIETRGTDPLLPDSAIFGVGLAWRTGDGEPEYVYFVYQTLSDTAKHTLWACVARARGAVCAHNLMFEMAWIRLECARLSVSEPRWTHCTYALYKQLATEGFPGQSHSLKTAQVELLLWPESNAAPVDEWLIARGYHKQGPKRDPDDTNEQHLAKCADWVAVDPVTRARKIKADKAHMWRVPPSILGLYCLLDCLSTMQFFEDVLWPVLEDFPELDDWHREYFACPDGIDSLLVEGTAAGIRVDQTKLELHGARLRHVLDVARADLRAGPLGAAIRAIEQSHIDKYRAKEPVRHRKVKETQEPPKFKKKTGELTKSWIAWDVKRRRGPVETKPWLAWREKLDKLEAWLVPSKRFNFSSPKQLRRVLYKSHTPDDNLLGSIEWRRTDRTAYKKGQDVPIFEIKGVNGWVDLQGTDKGELPVNGDLFSQLPAELKDPLQAYADAEQELTFVEAYLAEAGRRGGRIHPKWKSPGTKTLRLAGGDGSKKKGSINLQQAPKTIQLLECLIADDEEEWVEGDWSALEPHALAEMSRDPALLGLYGKGAPKHDVYLYSGSHYAVLGDKIRPHYDIQKPDVSAAKKACKSEREACKVVVLAKSYGAGAKKIHAGLRLKGFQMGPEDAKQISESHDEMYRVSGRDFHRVLEREFEMRGGWLLTGLGHPNPVWEGATKDLINRVVQRTGHDVHTMFVVRVARRLRREGIKATGVVWDFHDQLIFSVRRGEGARCLELLREEIASLNEMLGASVPLKMEPKVCTDMARAKEAEFDWTSVRGYSEDV